METRSTSVASLAVKLPLALALAAGLGAGAAVATLAAQPVRQAHAAAAKPAKVKKVKAVAAGANAVKVTWKKAKRAKTYKIRFSANKNMKSAKTVAVKGKAAKKRTKTVTGLSSQTRYYFQVKAVNKGKSGKWSKKASVVTASAASAPGAPAVVTYSISYNANDGVVPGGNTGSYTAQTATFKLPVPTRSGCEFEGWYTSSDYSGQAVAEVKQGSTGDLTFYAKWSMDYSTVVADTTAKTYTGAAIQPAASAPSLREDVDYKVTYADNVNAGTASMTVQGIGTVTGSKTYTFTIEQLQAQLAWDTTSALVYNGAAQAPACAVANAVAGDDVAVTVGGAAADAGSHTATATGLGNANYRLPADGLTCDFTINKADPSYTVPTDFEATEDMFLSDIIFPSASNGLFAWEDPAASVGTTGTNEFKATFTPNDTANYNTVTGIVVKVKVAAKTVFAMYSIGDDSLSFYKRAKVPAAGDEFDGKEVTAVYTGILETGTTQPGWSDYKAFIKTVKVVDDGIKPASTASWFSGFSKVTSIDISKLNMSNTTDMNHMFESCEALTALTLPSLFSTSKVVDVNSMFYDCKALTSIDMPAKFDTSNATNMYCMFCGCESLTSLTLPDTFDTSSVANMSYMFGDCSVLTSLVLPAKFDTSSVSNMSYMFWNCEKLAALVLPEAFDTSKVTLMHGMFKGCSALATLSLSSTFNTSSVKEMTDMFSGCSALTSLALPAAFNTANVTNMSYMFRDCTALTSLVLPSKFDTSSVEYMQYMFSGCSALATLTLPDAFSTSNVTNMKYMFSECQVLTLDCSGWDVSKVSTRTGFRDGAPGVVAPTWQN